MSERKRYLIDVEMVSHNLSGNSEWCSVRIPADGPSVLPVRFRDLRDAPDDEQWRLLESLKDERGAMLDRIADAAGVNTWQESVSAISALRDRVAELERERDEAQRQVRALLDGFGKQENRAERAEQERDEARSEAEAARARSNADRNATNKACRERDAARREAAELRENIREMTGVQRELARHANAYQRELLEVRRENERLHDIACSKLADELETTPRDDQPAPQTHFRSGDVTVNAGGDYRRLGNLIRVDKDDGIEEWESADAPSGSVVLSVTESPILERDGIPTDAGLRSLAEKAGFQFVRESSDYGFEGMQIDDGVPHMRRATAFLHGDSPTWRKRLADALREMEVGQ